MNNQKHHDVLVLNRSWAPVHIVIWQKAMSLIYKEHAHAIDRGFIAYKFNDWLEFSASNAEDYQRIKTVSVSIAIPEIIALTLYNKLPDRDVKFSRQNIFIRDNDTCQYCMKKFKRKDLTIDHIIPRDQGGTSNWDNIVACCGDCNAQKANRTQREMRERYPHDGNKWFLKKKPTRPKWFNPLSSVNQQKIAVCKSWGHFLKKIDTRQED